MNQDDFVAIRAGERRGVMSSRRDLLDTLYRDLRAMGKAVEEETDPEQYSKKLRAYSLATKEAMEVLMDTATVNNSPSGETMTLAHLDRLVRVQTETLQRHADVLKNLADVSDNLMRALGDLADAVKMVNARLTAHMKESE